MNPLGWILKIRSGEGRQVYGCRVWLAEANRPARAIADLAGSEDIQYARIRQVLSVFL